MDEAVERAIAAARAGRPILLPTDTVYGLCTAADREPAATAVYRLKGRAETQPTALLTASLDALYDALPELRGDEGMVARALLPGPFTLVLPNPARRHPSLTGTRPDAPGVPAAVLPA